MQRNKTMLFVGLACIALLASWLMGTRKPLHSETQTRSAIAPLQTAGSEDAGAGLPSQIDRLALSPALNDPFAYHSMPTLTLPPKPKPVAAAWIVQPAQPVFAMPMPLAAPVPSAPQLNLRFTGRMVTPDGQQLVFANLREEPVTLSVGQNLSNGYRVDSISERLVQLTYIALGTPASLELPAPPPYETR